MDWTVWYDTTGVETANSCVKFYSNALDWVSSRHACAAACSGNGGTLGYLSHGEHCAHGSGSLCSIMH